VSSFPETELVLITPDSVLLKDPVGPKVPPAEPSSVPGPAREKDDVVTLGFGLVPANPANAANRDPSSGRSKVHVSGPKRTHSHAAIRAGGRHASFRRYRPDRRGTPAGVMAGHGYPWHATKPGQRKVDRRSLNLREAQMSRAPASGTLIRVRDSWGLSCPAACSRIQDEGTASARKRRTCMRRRQSRVLSECTYSRGVHGTTRQSPMFGVYTRAMPPPAVWFPT
jgi:hypothetical protein